MLVGFSNHVLQRKTQIGILSATAVVLVRQFDRWRSRIHLFLDCPFSLRGVGPIGVSLLAIVQEASQDSLIDPFN